VTGDLARKKLLPAVYDLANRGLLPPGFVVLGFARRDWGDGDCEALAGRGRPLLHLHFTDRAAGIAQLLAALEKS